jgi:hypothetical protein
LVPGTISRFAVKSWEVWSECPIFKLWKRLCRCGILKLDGPGRNSRAVGAEFGCAAGSKIHAKEAKKGLKVEFGCLTGC